MKFGEFAAAIEQRSAAGAELELNASMGIAGNRFPLELLAPPPEHRPPQEQRRDCNGERRARRWLEPLRNPLASQWNPCRRGSFPVTTAGASAAQRAKDEATADTSWEIGVTELKPKRNAATASKTQPGFLVGAPLADGAG